MSVHAMAVVFDHSASRGAARLVLLAMANEASSNGELTAYARSQSHLAKRANVDVDTVRRSILSLVALGEVEIMSHGSGRTQAEYRICLPGLDSPQPAGTAPAPPQNPLPAGPEPAPTGGQHPPDAGAIIPLLPVANPVLPVGPSPRAKPRSRLPDSFILSIERRRAAEKAGVPEAGVAREFTKFRDHHLARGSLMADWDAAWRTWYGNAAEWAKGRGGNKNDFDEGFAKATKERP